jgi:HD-GYP domain-containing protein (c-di-GMP phosphodiesterase class II)
MRRLSVGAKSIMAGRAVSKMEARMVKTAQGNPDNGPAAGRPVVCSICGAPIMSPPFARTGADYCCEACFFKFHEDHRRIKELGRADPYLDFSEALVEALDAREHETGLHSKRVASHTLVLARRFTADNAVLQQVYWGALLHDIGKIGIPDVILLKHGALDPEEWEVMHTHPVIGHRILSNLPLMGTAAEIVLHHEERFDGTGYPDGLRGEQISWWARLFAVIDTLDAITSDRPYRKGMPFNVAQQEIVKMSGTQFDPRAVEAFVAEAKILEEMVDLKSGEAIYSFTPPAITV